MKEEELLLDKSPSPLSSLIMGLSSPEGMTKKLYPHQLAALEKMEIREKEKKIRAFHYEIDLHMGIYADIAGFGKTVTIIGLILRDRMEWNIHEELIRSSIINVYGNGYIVKRSLSSYHRMRTNLVVATPLVLNQWVEELKETTLCYTVVTNRRMCEQVDPADVDILLTIPTYYNNIVDRFPNCAWKRFIYDDPTHCRIPSMRHLVAGHIWMLSATPDMLLYQHRSINNFMSSIFSTNLDYNIYKHLIIKNPDDFVRQSFSLPPCVDIYHRCYEPIFWIVQDIISPGILQMISAGNIEGAIKAMGGSSMSSNLYDLLFREKKEALQQAEWKIARWKRSHHIQNATTATATATATAAATASSTVGDHDKIVKWELKRNKLMMELSQLRQRIRTVLSEDQCPICFDSFQDPVMLTCCQNIFCGKCILNWIGVSSSTESTTESTCPLCRLVLTSAHLVHMKDTIVMMEKDDLQNCQNGGGDMTTTTTTTTTTGKEEEEDNINHHDFKFSKIQVLEHLLDTYPEGKFIIFSAYDETFRKIREVLTKCEIRYAELSGRRPETKMRVIQDFKDSKTGVLFMNSIHDGAGVNIHEATDIVLYHEMSEMMRTQIVGRAYRIGRKEPLRVHHLLETNRNGVTTMTTPQQTR